MTVVSTEALRAHLHALSQPLTAIALCLELAAEEGLPGALGCVLLDARSECERALQAFESLRALARQTEQN